ncbi:MAG TPA: nucleotide sugar dehydrogenase, partial [Bacteroidales bacterium]|nr:nucleotide sugar dehydrogenase [Bacteroidales bacterium]
HNVEITTTLPKEQYDTIILAVAHKEFATLNIQTLLNPTNVIFDVKSFLPKEIVDGRL